MVRLRKGSVSVKIALAAIIGVSALMVSTAGAWATGNALWIFGGHDLENTRHAKTETSIDTENGVRSRGQMGIRDGR